MTHIAAIAPIYNSRATLPDLIAQLCDSLSKISKDYSIILVDDRGRQDVWSIISEAAEENPRICGIRLSRNFGQHPAITAGLDVADADWVVVMDGDLQDRPEDIPKLYRHANENNHQIVIAGRETSGLGLWRVGSSMLFNWILNKISGLSLSHKHGNFRIISRQVVSAYKQHREQMRFFPALMNELGFEPVILMLPRDKRPDGKSSYSLYKLMKLAFSIMIAYSTRPLVFLAGLGLIIAVAAFLTGIFYFLRYYFVGSIVQGWTTLAIAVFGLGGLQIFVTSFVGIYVGEVFKETKSRPLYIISRLTPNLEDT